MGIAPGKENENGFSKEEIAQLEGLASLYMQAKSLILYSEEVDPDYRSNLQTIKELRDAFDHLMRFIVERFSDDKSSLGDVSGTEYFQKKHPEVYWPRLSRRIRRFRRGCNVFERKNHIWT
jgi:hypothetical protein